MEGGGFNPVQCIYKGLSLSFGTFEPNWEIAKYWNMDVEQWLNRYRSAIAKAQTSKEAIKQQKIIAKKLLRASYSLIMHRDKQWYDDPIECGQAFLRYYPDKQTDIERLGILYAGYPVPKRSVVGLLDSYGTWLVKMYQKTEFRIG